MDACRDTSNDSVNSQARRHGRTRFSTRAMLIVLCALAAVICGPGSATLAATRAERLPRDLFQRFPLRPRATTPTTTTSVTAATSSPRTSTALSRPGADASGTDVPVVLLVIVNGLAVLAIGVLVAPLVRRGWPQMSAVLVGTSSRVGRRGLDGAAAARRHARQAATLAIRALARGGRRIALLTAATCAPGSASGRCAGAFRR